MKTLNNESFVITALNKYEKYKKEISTENKKQITFKGLMNGKYNKPKEKEEDIEIMKKIHLIIEEIKKFAVEKN